jgi:hypothetical protein
MSGGGLAPRFPNLSSIDAGESVSFTYLLLHRRGSNPGRPARGLVTLQYEAWWSSGRRALWRLAFSSRGRAAPCVEQCVRCSGLSSAWADGRIFIFLTLNMEVLCFSETVVLTYKFTLPYYPDQRRRVASSSPIRLTGVWCRTKGGGASGTHVIQNVCADLVLYAVCFLHFFRATPFHKAH